MKCKVKALAKINLNLSIEGLRPDGMHDINSVMHTIALHDDITITPLEDASLIVKCDDSKVPSGRDNIVFSAVELIRGIYKINRGLEIEIIKRIPSAAGLGGGSSDAACVINALNDMWNLNMSFEDKKKIALMVGSDVPFFLDNNAAFVSGVGEIITKLCPLPEFSLLLVKPKIDVNTASAYKRWDELEIFSKTNVCAELAEMMKSEQSREYWMSNLKPMIYNSFLEVSKADGLGIDILIDKLYSRGAFACGMTGSGPTVFALFKQNEIQSEIVIELEDYEIIYTKISEKTI